MREGKPKMENPFDKDEGVTDAEHDALRIALAPDHDGEKKNDESTPPKEKPHGEF